MLATQKPSPRSPQYSQEKKHKKGGRVLLYLYFMYQVLYDKSLFYTGAVASPSTDASVVSCASSC
jgi:hypothetical protein